MIYTSYQMEEKAILETAAHMCAAARTAPKARGIDNILTFVLTGAEKDALAAKLDEIAQREFKGSGPFPRDAKNVRAAQAVVLIGVKRVSCKLPYCSLCGFASCQDCDQAGARCVFNGIDLGIAVCSAVAVAADNRVDNRVMYTIGKAAEEMGYTDEKSVIWHGIPISVSGKSIFFDRG